MASEENVNEFKIKTIKDLELMAKKLKKRIVALEKTEYGDEAGIVNITHSITLLTAEYRLIKREIIDIITL